MFEAKWLEIPISISLLNHFSITKLKVRASLSYHSYDFTDKCAVPYYLRISQCILLHFANAFRIRLAREGSMADQTTVMFFLREWVSGVRTRMFCE